MISEIFKKYIVKQVVGSIYYSHTEKAFRIRFKTVTPTIRNKIVEEGKQWNIDENFIDDIINSTLHDIQLVYTCKEVCVQTINISKDLSEGSILRLFGAESDSGKMELKLLYMGCNNERKEHRFCVLESSCLALQPYDVLEPFDSLYISVEYPVLLKVFRHNKRIPDETHVFRIYTLQCLTRITPSIIHDVIDSQKKFTYIEHVSEIITKERERLCWGTNPMTMLLHNYSIKMPIYVDFEEGGIGSFYANKEIVLPPSKIRNQMFDIPDDAEKRKIKVIRTENGEIVLGPEGIMLHKKAKCEYRIV